MISAHGLTKRYGRRTVVDLVDRGLIDPFIDQTGGLEDAERFQQRVVDGVVIGRDVLVPEQV